MNPVPYVPNESMIILWIQNRTDEPCALRSQRIHDFNINKTGTHVRHQRQVPMLDTKLVSYVMLLKTYNDTVVDLIISDIAKRRPK